MRRLRAGHRLLASPSHLGRDPSRHGDPILWVAVTGEAKTRERQKVRYTFIDTARGFAIGLALFSHVMLGVGGWSALDDGPTWMYGFRVLTRTATPTFIILFGVSAELAYVNRWGRDAPGTVRRLLRRAVQCYVALVAVAIAAVIGTLMTVPEALLSLVFLENVVNGSIFAFYVVALLLCLALIPLRRTIGLLPTLAITLAWWPTAALLSAVVDVPEGINAFTSRVLGIGTEFGPSVFHSMALVVGGMVVGDFIKNPCDVRARIRAGVFVSLALLGAVGAVALDGPVGAASGFTAEYRQYNSFGYYSIGALLAIAVLVVCWLVALRIRLGVNGPGAFGGSSLQAFAIGNVLINLFIAHVRFESFWPAAALGVGFVAAYWIVFRAWIRFYKSDRLEGLRYRVGG